MKTKQWIRTACSLAMGALLTVGMASCNPETPVDESRNKLHEDPFKAVLTLREGTLQGGTFNEQPRVEHFKPAANVAEQSIVWETKENEGWKITSSTKQFTVKNTSKDPNVVYYLTFEYYDRDGKPMNYQFFDNGQDRIHQHFFSVYKQVTVNGSTADARVTKKQELPYDYNYADVYNGKYIADINPMGFQGFMRFVKPSTNFVLTVELLHSTSSKLEADGTPSPFYLPSKVNRSTGLWDINISIPVTIQ